MGGCLRTQSRVYTDSSNTVQFLHASWVWFLHASLALSKHFPFLSLILSSVFIVRPEGAEWIRSNKTIKTIVKCKVLWIISCLAQRNSRTVARHKRNFRQIWRAAHYTAHYNNTIYLWEYPQNHSIQWGLAGEKPAVHTWKETTEEWKRQGALGFVVVVELWYFSCWPFQGQLGQSWEWAVSAVLAESLSAVAL